MRVSKRKHEQNGKAMTPAQAEANRKRANREAAAMSEEQRVQYDEFGRLQVRGSSRNWVKSGYESADKIRRTGGPSPKSNLSEFAQNRNLKSLRDLSQYFDRTNCIYQAMLTRVCDVVLGAGLTVQSKAGVAAPAVERLWNKWWGGRPEVRGLDSGPDIERKTFRHILADGDHLWLPIDPQGEDEEGRIQCIVAGQLDYCSGGTARRQGSNWIQDGVEFDSELRPVAFHVSKYTPDGTLQSYEQERIPAEKAIFLANRRRIDQFRGEPVGQAAFAMLHRINDVCDSEAAAWQLLSRIAVGIESDTAAANAYAKSEPDPDLAGDAATRTIADRVQDIGTALIVNLKKGEKLSGIERNIPGANFENSIKMFMRLMGLPFGFSLEFTLLLWSDTNYSSGRASIKQVERNTKPWRCQLEYAMSRVFKWKVAEWIEKKLLPDDNPAIFDHRWSFPPYPFIDPQKEREAQIEAIKSGLTTPQREAVANGDDWAELTKERAEAFALAAQKVAVHNELYPDYPLTIQDFIPREMQPSTPAVAPADAPEPPEGDNGGSIDEPPPATVSTPPPAAPPPAQPEQPEEEDYVNARNAAQLMMLYTECGLRNTFDDENNCRRNVGWPELKEEQRATWQPPAAPKMRELPAEVVQAPPAAHHGPVTLNIMPSEVRAPDVHVAVPVAAPPTVNIPAPVVNVEVPAAPPTPVHNEIKLPPAAPPIVSVPSKPKGRKRIHKINRNAQGDMLSIEVDDT